MAEYIIQDTTLTGIADAIREKTGETAGMSLSEMPTKINKLSDTSKDTIGAEFLVEGYTAHDSSGAQITGTVKDMSNHAEEYDDRRLPVYAPGVLDFYVLASGNTSPDVEHEWLPIYYRQGFVIKGDLNLVPANIVKGETIFGVEGAAEITGSSDSAGIVTVTNNLDIPIECSSGHIQPGGSLEINMTNEPTDIAFMTTYLFGTDRDLHSQYININVDTYSYETQERINYDNQMLFCITEDESVGYIHAETDYGFVDGDSIVISYYES